MAQGDRVAKWSIGIFGDDADFSQVLSGLKGKFTSALQDMQRIGDQIDIFKSLSETLGSLKGVIDRNTAAAKQFQDAIDAAGKAGQKPSQDLVDGLKKATDASALATKEYNRQVDQITKLQGSLTKAGVDTNNLAAAETRLAAATAEATEALAVQSAKSALGFKTFSDVQPKIDALNAAFNTLRDSGTLAPNEIVQASRKLEVEIASLAGSVTNLKGGLAEAGEKGASAFEAMGGPALTVIAILTTLIASIKGSVTAANDFAQGVGKIGTVTDLTQAQLDSLGASARALSVTLGLDLKQSLEALYQIIRSTNLGPDDALTVLEASARAAKASFTDLNVVTSVSADLISAFGLKASEVSSALDALFASAKTGGPTFQDLSGKIGGLSVVAEGAGLSVNQMSAFLNVMVSASGDSAGSISALQKILTAFSTEKVRAELRDMGITTTNAGDAIQQLTARGNINLNTLLDLGIASSKSAAGVTALTRSSTDLDAALDRATDSLGKVVEGAEKADKLPHDTLDKLVASLKDLSLNTGISDYFTAVVGGLIKVTNAASDTAVALRRQRDALSEAQQDLLQYNAEAQGAATAEGALADSAARTNSELRAFRQLEDVGFGKGLTEDAQALNAAIENVSKGIATLRNNLEGIGKSLQEDIKAMNDAATEQLSQITKIADEQIAALDRGTAAQTQTAAKTVDIQTQLAADRLKIVSDNEAAITKATFAAMDAREAAVRKDRDLNETEEAKLQSDLANIRLASIKPTIAAYQSLYDNLVGQEQAYAAKLESIQKGKLASQESYQAKILENQLGAVDASGKALFSQADKDVAYLNDATRLISLARAAAAQGDVENAKKYADQAIAQSDKIQKAYDQDGNEIISQDKAQQTQLSFLLEGNKLVGDAYDKQAEQAKAGMEKTKTAIDQVKDRLDIVLAIQKDMQAVAAEGLKVKADVDQKSFDATSQAIDDLTRARTVIVTFKSEGTPAAPLGTVTPIGGGGATGEFAGGGYVGKSIQGFATGGPVFRPLSGSKVPGSGSGDTHPAMLRLGSFVMRKAASESYGDGIMGRLARGYAAGGTVGAYDPNQFPNLVPNATATAVDPAALHQLKVYADELVGTLASLGAGLPRPTSGQSLANYLVSVRNIIDNDNDLTEVRALVQALDNSAESYRDTFLYAQSLNPKVPAVMGGSANGLDLGASRTSPAFLALSAKIQAHKFAGGGPVGTDTIPAWLTPGEHVLNPPAVQFAARMFGGGFLDAVNNMQVPKISLQNMMDIAPPRRYANGGYVDGPGAPAVSVTEPASKNNGALTVNIYPQHLTEQELNTTVLPWLNRKLRTSR